MRNLIGIFLLSAASVILAAHLSVDFDFVGHIAGDEDRDFVHAVATLILVLLCASALALAIKEIIKRGWL